MDEFENLEAENVEDEQHIDASDDADLVASEAEDDEMSESYSDEGEKVGKDGYEIYIIRSDEEVEADEEGDGGDAEDETNIRFRRCDYPKYVPGITIDFVVGMRFDRKEQFKELATAYAVKNHRDIYFHKVDKKIAELKCVEGRPFHVWEPFNIRLRCFQIKVIKSKHLCSKRYELRLATSKWLAKRFFTELRDDPSMRLKALREKVRKDTQLQISKHIAKYVKKDFRKTLGSPDYEYSFLRDYTAELLRTNPGSSVILKTTPTIDGLEEKFQRIYICFEACKRGLLEGFGRVVGIYGCFLKSTVKREIMTVVGRDANDQMFPIAWAIVEVENKDSWLWFLTLLKMDLGMENDSDWVIISDQQKGLIPVVRTLFPSVEHRLCARHICSNWKKRFPRDEFKGLFWNCANNTSERQFQDALEIVDQHVGAKEALLMIHLKHWVKAFFNKNVKCDANQNNLCKTFNGVEVVLKVGEKLIFSLLEDIRKYMMARVVEKRAFQQRWNGQFGEEIVLKLDESYLEHHEWKITFNGDFGYEIEKDYEGHAMRLELKTCTCGKWDVSRIICTHVITCIVDIRHRGEDYLDDCFRIDKFEAAYKYSLQPIGGPNVWTKIEGLPIIPPDHRNMAGRRRLKKIRQADEPKNAETISKKWALHLCSVCKNHGHNKTKCPLKGKDNVCSTQTIVGSQNNIGEDTRGRGGSTRKRGGNTWRGGNTGRGLQSSIGFGVYTNLSTGKCVFMHSGEGQHTVLHQGESSRGPKNGTRKGRLPRSSRDYELPSTTP